MAALQTLQLGEGASQITLSIPARTIEEFGTVMERVEGIYHASVNGETYRILTPVVALMPHGTRL